ncbi:hypothetical protein MESS2_1230003 [Mesorhizobium metallidurans STM 2683]|uniref:Uncharacterized protein n=1 Tax=Mesorhizobium metallidurans STM 2683 TaxID=1297569 RepID=M5EII8_9HYPH|nr:hypothetical protein MESS2_1230003 [Mesorhizobium metallidurans STM 2683]
MSISSEVRRPILDHYPSTRKPAVCIAGRLAGLIASLLAVQIQSVQRSFTSVDPDLVRIAEEFMALVISEAGLKTGSPELNRPLAPPPLSAIGSDAFNTSILVDWAGLTAVPTALEKAFWHRTVDIVSLRDGWSDCRNALP